MKLDVAVAETFGTAMLVLVAVGTAVLAGETMGALGVALAFGLILLVMAYAIGHVSGCHINPAVTVGMALAGKMERREVPLYLVSQVIGAVIGAALLYLIANGVDGFSIDSDAAGAFGANGYDDLSPGGYNLLSGLVSEIVFTAVFVFVVLGTVHRSFPAAVGGVAAGLALTVVHLVSIPVTNTSVNPARSIGPALFAGGDYLVQLWLFIVAPTVGALLAAGLFRALEGAEEAPADEAVTGRGRFTAPPEEPAGA